MIKKKVKLNHEIVCSENEMHVSTYYIYAFPFIVQITNYQSKTIYKGQKIIASYFFISKQKLQTKLVGMVTIILKTAEYKDRG